jgi:hypothetical protein
MQEGNMAAPAIYVIHENDAWVEPLRAAFGRRALPFEEWFLDGAGQLDLDRPPPEGVFYNRMSASSFTRGHRFAPEQTALVLAWLERSGRRVVNDGRALRLEISKAAQHAALASAGIRVPRTVAAVGRRALLEAAARLPANEKAILKPNRGGKGHGVQLFEGPAALADFVRSEAWEAPVDEVSLLQQFIASPDGFITRAEFVGGRFLYAVRVDTGGSFALCPADVCSVGDAFCPAEAPGPRFQITDPPEAAMLASYESFLAANGIEIAGIEFVRDAEGRAWTYDVNTNTNYNSDAERGSEKRGMDAIAAFLGGELHRLYGRATRRRAG